MFHEDGVTKSTVLSYIMQQ